MASILACIDGSIYSQSVADHAAWAARRLGADLDLLQVLGRRDMGLSRSGQPKVLEELAALEQERARLLRRQGQLDLEEAQVRVEAQGVAQSRLSLVVGDLLDVLAEREPAAEIVVIGKRGAASDFAKGHLGSNLERVARASTRPLLVAARAFRPVQRLTLAYDAGPSAQRAVEHALSTPLYAGLEIDVATVGAETLDARRRMESVVSRLRGAGLHAAPHFLKGDPAGAIAAHVEARGADMVLMGAYGHSRLRSLVIGSTTAETIRRCRVPIMLYR